MQKEKNKPGVAQHIPVALTLTTQPITQVTLTSLPPGHPTVLSAGYFSCQCNTK